MTRGLPLLIAHRGYSSRYRENSPAAWAGAVAAGADAIEVDLRLSRDGALVCCHDPTLERLAGRGEVVAECDGAELAAIEADGYPAAPPLALLLATVPATQALVLDVKDERPVALDVLARTLTAMNRATLVVGLHTVEAVRHVRRRGWAGRVLGFLREARDEDAFFAEGGDILRLWEGEASPDRIRYHTDRTRPVWVTTGGGDTGRKVGDLDPEALLRMAREGVGGLLVNDPVGGRAALEAGLARR